MSSTHDDGPWASGPRDAAWVKSSRSGPTGGNCVELAHLPGGRVAVRHSRDPDGPALVFSPAEWDAFLAGAKGGEFDRPALGLRTGVAEVRTLGYTGRHRAGLARERPGGGTVARRSLCGRGEPAA